MVAYVAFLRGIAPMNPNMRNENLRKVCEELGLAKVQTVVSSGNIVFETATDIAALEQRLESAWQSRLGFESTTIIRSESDLQRLVDLAPFGDREHGKESYLLVTFSKKPLDLSFDTPYQPPERDYWVVGATERELFTVTNTITYQTPDVMSWLEKEFGKRISSRTWLTVNRVLNRMRKT